jgi:lysophospholipase L1-like esterase
LRKLRIVNRLALVLGSLVVTLALLEGFLQIGAWAMHASEREAPEDFESGTLSVLCLGDSNTYGFYVDRAEAYPQRLEALWREHGYEPPIDVMNLGFPGLNSSRLLLQYPELVERLAPDLIIIMIGVNDFWTVPASSDEEAGLFTPARRLLERHSRVYRLLRMVRRSIMSNEALQVGEFGVQAIIDPGPLPNDRGARHRLRIGDREIDMGFRRAGPVGVQGYQEDLHNSLQQLVAETDRFPSRLFFMTYPSREDFYGIANRIVRQVARDTDTPLIDLARVFTPLCPTEPCPALLYADHHPTADGYRVIAETLVTRLGETLRD